jgi:hypothetical protein
MRSPPHSRTTARSALPTLATLAALSIAGCGEDAPPPRAPEARATLSLSPARAKVGEPVELLMTVEHPVDTEARFPPPETLTGAGSGGGLEAMDEDSPDGPTGSASGAGLEIVKAGRPRTRELEEGWLVTERTVTVRGFRTGPYTLGPHEVRLVTSDGAGPEKLAAPPVTLEVYSVLADSSTLADLRGEAGPFEIEPEPARWGWAIMIALAVVAHVVMGGFALRRLLRRRNEARLHPPLPPPHETALAELARIRESGLLDEGKTAEYTDRVSDVLRLYLEERFALPAPDRTTEEFLDEVARAPVLDRERKRFLADYLAQCDLVKFAARLPGRRELDELFGSSVKFVEETAGARAAPERVGS